MNEALSEELFAEGCKQLAIDKASIAKVEFLISKRIDNLILGIASEEESIDDSPMEENDNNNIMATDEDEQSDSSQGNSSN